MGIKLLKIKNKYNYDWDDDVFLRDFNVKLVKIFKQELQIGANIYYIGYLLENEYDSVKPLYLTVNHLFGYIEEIKGSSDRYLVANINNEKVINVFDKLWKFIGDEINVDNKISEYNKLRFISAVDLPLDTLTNFHTLTIAINCVIEKDDKYYPEIYLDDWLYESDIT